MVDVAIKTAVILTAAGISSRFATGQKKEYIPMRSILQSAQSDGTVLSCSAEPFLQFFSMQSHFTLCNLVITISPGDLVQNIREAKKALFSSDFVVRLLQNLSIEPDFILGGNTRQESVFFALEYLERASGLQKDSSQTRQKESPNLVLIHDAARPFVTPSIVEGVLELTEKRAAAVAVIPPVDTQKEIGTDGIITRHLMRSHLVAVQTPQGFQFLPLLTAHKKALHDKKIYTDDTEIWHTYVGQVYTCMGSTDNIKITYQNDLEKHMNTATRFRTGFGYDFHRLVEGRPLILGGVTIPFSKGELAHSDGDVLLHAITDAVLGAAALGDIGEFFPPSDERWKDANSATLLQAAWRKVTENGWKLENLDCVVALERPKFLPWRTEICQSIAKILECDEDQVFVKAKTGEGLGEIGRGEAVSVWASCLLKH